VDVDVQTLALLSEESRPALPVLFLLYRKIRKADRTRMTPPVRSKTRCGELGLRAGARGNLQDANLVPELTASEQAWRRDMATVSLPEVHRSILVPPNASFLRKLFAFAGPGFLVAVGYMDPGNWATDLAG